MNEQQHTIIKEPVTKEQINRRVKYFLIITGLLVALAFIKINCLSFEPQERSVKVKAASKHSAQIISAKKDTVKANDITLKINTDTTLKLTATLFDNTNILLDTIKYLQAANLKLQTDLAEATKKIPKQAPVSDVVVYDTVRQFYVDSLRVLKLEITTQAKINLDREAFYADLRESLRSTTADKDLLTIQNKKLKKNKKVNGIIIKGAAAIAGFFLVKAIVK